MRLEKGKNSEDVYKRQITEYVENLVDSDIPADADPEDWDLVNFNVSLCNVIPMKPVAPEEVKDMNAKKLKHMLKERAVKLYEQKEAEFPEPEHIRELERVVLLKVIDNKWMDHIDDMDQLRQGIGLQAYGQRDPKVEYKMIGYETVSYTHLDVYKRQTLCCTPLRFSIPLRNPDQ